MGEVRDAGCEPKSDAVRVAYGISAYESNAMKSSNPHSGIYIAETARTLDNNGGNPACNQGGCLSLKDAIGLDLYNQCTTGGVENLE